MHSFQQLWISKCRPASVASTRKSPMPKGNPPELGIPNKIRYFGISVLPAALSGTEISNNNIGTDNDTEWMIPFGIGIRYR